MSNMSNSRFENTYNDLRECFEAMFEDKKLTDTEKYYRDEVIKLCKEITEQEFKLLTK